MIEMQNIYPCFAVGLNIDEPLYLELGYSGAGDQNIYLKLGLKTGKGKECLPFPLSDKKVFVMPLATTAMAFATAVCTSSYIDLSPDVDGNCGLLALIFAPAASTSSGPSSSKKLSLLPSIFPFSSLPLPFIHFDHGK